MNLDEVLSKPFDFRVAGPLVALSFCVSQTTTPRAFSAIELLPAAPATPHITALDDEVSAPEAGAPETAPRKVQLFNVLGVVLPLAGLVVACVLAWGWAFSWVYLALLLGMYIATGLGVTVGFHRLFTHKSFRTSRLGTWVWGVLGTMAGEGPIVDWVAYHRQHHQHSDAPGDPHSPHCYDDRHGHHHDHDEDAPRTFRAVLRGLWHAHAGWFIRRSETNACDPKRYCPDLLKDRDVVLINRTWLAWTILGIVGPGIIAAVIIGSWQALLLGILWGGFVRIAVVHHVTWSINSVCHIWGSRPYKSGDHSRNNALFGILGFGEGWHNNHHAFPTSARHGLHWWQFDSSWLVIRAMKLVGLAWDIKVPTPERIAAKRA